MNDAISATCGYVICDKESDFMPCLFVRQMQEIVWMLVIKTSMYSICNKDTRLESSDISVKGGINLNKSGKSEKLNNGKKDRK